jgi:ADP-ribose pyrophosphatase
MPKALFYSITYGIRIIHSKMTYRGRAFSVRKDQIRLPDGGVANLDIVDHVGAVTIIPLDDQRRLWFVRQYRHAAGKILLELPAGTLEPGEPPEDCARRELREEIGMRAEQLEKIGEFYLAPGYSTEYMHVYLATSLRPDALPGDKDEFLSVETIPVQNILELVKTRKIQDAKTLAAIFLAQAHLFTNQP